MTEFTRRFRKHIELHRLLDGLAEGETGYTEVPDGYEPRYMQRCAHMLATRRGLVIKTSVRILDGEPRLKITLLEVR